MHTDDIPTQAEVQDAFFYRPEEGTLHRRTNIYSRQKKAWIDNYSDPIGYWQHNTYATQWLGKRWRVVALIWLHQHGEWIGQDRIDHIDGNPCNFRIENLRRRVDPHRKPVRRTKPYRARLTLDGKLIDLGYFASKTEADAAKLSLSVPSWLL